MAGCPGRLSMVGREIEKGRRKPFRKISTKHVEAVIGVILGPGFDSPRLHLSQASSLLAPEKEKRPRLRTGALFFSSWWSWLISSLIINPLPNHGRRGNNRGMTRFSQWKGPNEFNNQAAPQGRDNQKS